MIFFNTRRFDCFSLYIIKRAWPFSTVAHFPWLHTAQSPENLPRSRNSKQYFGRTKPGTRYTIFRRLKKSTTFSKYFFFDYKSLWKSHASTEQSHSVKASFLHTFRSLLVRVVWNRCLLKCSIKINLQYFNSLCVCMCVIPQTLKGVNHSIAWVRSRVNRFHWFCNEKTLYLDLLTLWCFKGTFSDSNF